MNDIPSTARTPKEAPEQYPRLAAPVRITEQVWPEGTVPLVSIVCTTYNHEKFIRECVDGFLMQETTFPVEILIHDDASTDGTAGIIREYEKNHPQLIKPLYQTDNKYSKGIPIQRTFNFPRAQGQFIAVCEGDDYWIDPHKLQRQASFLERESEHVLVAENAVWYDTSTNAKRPFSSLPSRDIGVLEMLDKRQFATGSAMFRNLGLQLNPDFDSGDTILWCHLASLGKVRYEDVVSSVYHRHAGGATAADKMAWAKKMVEWNHALMSNHPDVAPEIFRRRNLENFQGAIGDLLNRGQYIQALDALEELPTLTMELEAYKTDLYAFLVELIRQRDRRIEGKEREIQDLRFSRSFLVGRIATSPIQGIVRTLQLIRREAFRIVPRQVLIRRRLQKRGIQFINKRKIRRNVKRLSTLAPEERRRSPPVIVTLTSYPRRIPDLFYNVYSLLDQTVQPDRLVLWLAEAQFPNKEADLPANLLSLRSLGLEIEWCEDLKSYKKLVPALRRFPAAVLVTADDDAFYPRDWLEKLYGAYLEDPVAIHCHRAHRVILKGDGEPEDYSKWPKSIGSGAASTLNFFTGLGGVLYPPQSLHADVLRTDLFMALCPTADDIWFWNMAVLNGTKIRVVENNWQDVVFVNPLEEFGAAHGARLFDMNRNKNDSYMRQVRRRYQSHRIKNDP